MDLIGIVGATGYAGVELVRLLLNHKKVEIAALSSVSYSGENIADVYGNLKGRISLICSSIEDVVEHSRVVFTSLPHGLSEDISEKCIQNNKICIDLGADFRLEKEEEYKEWYGKDFSKPYLHKLCAYGLPEMYREKIKTAPIIANPGCYPTSILLALMPALKEKILDTHGIIIDSKSGVTGAGRSLALGSHFPECNDSVSPYKIGAHRHIPEIEQVLSHMAEETVNITFVPHLLPINRGILSTIYCSLNEDLDIKQIHEIYKQHYEKESFVRVLDIGSAASIKNVKYSNYCDISLHKDTRTGKLIIVSALDNMVKGSAGQAIQNMNIVLGFKEQEGLDYIPPAF